MLQIISGTFIFDEKITWKMLYTIEGKDVLAFAYVVQDPERELDLVVDKSARSLLEGAVFPKK